MTTSAPGTDMYNRRDLEMYNQYFSVEAEHGDRRYTDSPLGGTWLLDALAQGGTWIDYGCGEGRALREARADPRFQHVRMIGVDYHRDQIEENRREAHDIEWVVHDVADGPIDAPHDNVTSVITLPYVADYMTAIQNIANTLEPGGTFWLAMFETATKDPDKININDVRSDAAQTLFAMLIKCPGFSINSINGIYTIKRTGEEPLDFGLSFARTERCNSFTGMGVSEPFYTSDQ